MSHCKQSVSESAAVRHAVLGEVGGAGCESAAIAVCASSSSASLFSLHSSGSSSLLLGGLAVPGAPWRLPFRQRTLTCSVRTRACSPFPTSVLRSEALRSPSPSCPPFPRPPAAEDTDDETLDLIKGVVAEVFDNPPPNAMFGEMARRIRVELDKRLESRGWSVVVGRAYGAYLTHKIQSFCVRGRPPKHESCVMRARNSFAHVSPPPPAPPPAPSLSA